MALKKHTENMLVFLCPDKNDDSGIKIRLISEHHRYYMSDNDVRIGDQNIECYIDIPDERELLLKAVETLKEKQKKIYADAEQQVGKIQKRIEQLLLLEHKPEN